MTDLDPTKPEPCAFCTDATRPTKAWLMPWREATGWWCCSDSVCMQKVKTRTYQTLDTRRLVSVKSLPDWFLNKSFRVRSTSGDIRYMEVMNFPHKFNDNGGGRLRLSINRTPDDIYIDMCTMDRTHKKQVPLRDLYETNTEMIEHGVIELNFPKYVTDARKREWRESLETALQVGRDVVDSMKNHPETLTDSEEDDDHQDVVDRAEVIMRSKPKFEPNESSTPNALELPNASSAPSAPNASSTPTVLDSSSTPNDPNASSVPNATSDQDTATEVKKKSIAPVSTETDVTNQSETTDSDEIVAVGGGELIVTEFIQPSAPKAQAAPKFSIAPRSTVVVSDKFDPMDW